MIPRNILALLILGSLVSAFFSCSAPVSYSDTTVLWPEPTMTMKPWTRWWWHGNAVDKKNITNRLEEFAAAGIGGVEITPIFGVKGYEDRFIQHLSPEWMDMLIHTLEEAERLDLGVDMVQGTGWPFGGPQVEKEFAAGKLFVQTYPVKAGEKFVQELIIDEPEQEDLATLQFVYAYDDDGKKTDLTSRVKGNQLELTLDTDHTVLAIFNGKTNQQVKRSAPGGEGFVLDHFSQEALADYVNYYEQVLGPIQGRLRALFNDSYEVYDADYTTHLFKEFNSRRGYDFTDHLPLLESDSGSEETLRILADYRETLSDLVLEAMSGNWVNWATEHAFLTKYQAHGAPGNLLDIYATADIPECESFYATDFDIPGLRREESDALKAYPDLVMLKFASSAAHISGKSLTSSETLTWLREHFKTALSQCKPEVEQIFLSGVNHVFFHGSTYYPDEAPWPGWKFYASVNLVPTYTIWQDAPYMFEYITRCQSFLQSGQPDNEILVYWPFHDVIGNDLEGKLLFQLSIHNKDEWLVPQPFHKLAMQLMDMGYSLDFVSDRILKETLVEDGNIKTPGMAYDALVVPDCRHMPVSTMEALVKLNESGGKVILGGLPETVPGYHMHEERSSHLLTIIADAKDDLNIVDHVPAALEKKGILGEGFQDTGLDFIRRKLEDGKVYYLLNHTPDAVDGFINIGATAKSVVIMDPLTGKAGQAEIKPRRGGTDVYLQIKPGDALLLRTFEMPVQTEEWVYLEKTGNPIEIAGTWDLEFLSGGPSVPEKVQMEKLESWTGLGSEGEAFSGTARYTLEFDTPNPGIDYWLLDLGDVRESARVRIDGQDLGCLWSVPFQLEIDSLKGGKHTLEMEVTNLSANRLRDLEMRGVEWKIFYEINLVNRHYETFDATTWDPMPSGILGPVSLTPMRRITF